jgi:hypothetical protein
MTSLTTITKKGLLVVSLMLISSYCFTASAQSTTSNSRVAVVSNETKTNIWVSDFPKKTSIVISDNEDNLISVVSTNDFGAAFISLPKSIKNTIIVKTLDGETIATNKAVNKNNKEEQTAVSNTVKDETKA